MCRLQGAQQQAGMSRFVCGAHRAGGVAGCGGGGGRTARQQMWAGQLVVLSLPSSVALSL